MNFVAVAYRFRQALPTVFTQPGGPPFGRAPYACHSFPLLILSLPQLVVDGLVEPDAHAGHLLEHPLPPEALQPVDLQLRVPDVLQALGRDVYLLEDGRMIL